MTLDAKRLGNAIYTGVKSLSDKEFVDTGIWERISAKIAEAVVKEIVSSATVTVNVAAAQLGVVPGPTGGPVPVVPTPLTGKVT